MTSDLESGAPSEIRIGGASFEQFYNEQRRSLITLAYAMTGSRQTAEDLAQEALIATYQKWDDIKAKDNPGTWVRRILINTASSHYRRGVVELKALARRPWDPTEAAFPEVTGDLDRIWREVRRLPKRQTQVIALIHLEGLSQVEIAEILGISKESVNTHLRRARQTLAKALNLEEEL